MQYFFYGRDRPDVAGTRRALLKEHWAFMRRYADAMIARGPTMSADGRKVTGSMHMVDLPDAASAQTFAYDDPLARGGVFEDILVRRFYNVPGRTMWQFNGNAKNPRFLFIGEALPGTARQGTEVLPVQRAYLAATERASSVIAHGPLLGADGAEWLGTAMLLECANGAAAETLVQGDPAVSAKLYARTRLLPWRFGGEENLQDLIAGN